MPSRKKKPFIDKKNAVTFHLVHRSQRDPQQANEDASQRVLLAEPGAAEARKEEEKTYGVFFEDDYDYMQHLKSVDELHEVEPIETSRIATEPSDVEKGKLVLPSSVFASELETVEGLLSKATPQSGPQPDWDPDIVAALDDDFNFDDPSNELDDDFMAKAMEEGDGSDYQEEEQESASFRTHAFVAQQRALLGHDIELFSPLTKRGRDGDGDESDVSSDFGTGGSELDEEDRLGEMPDPQMDGEDRLGEMPNFDAEETKSRFTDYSMSSSVIKRNQGLSLLDDRFEKLYEQYDDDEIGALDHEDIGGFINPGSELLEDALAQFSEFTKKTTMRDVVQPAEDMEVTDSESESEDDELEKVVVEAAQEKWDCESILSTHSTLYNHPKLIEEPKKIHLTKRAQIPSGVLHQAGPTNKQVEQMSRLDKVPVYRPKDETPEERKARKQAIKEERRMRRVEKKANQEAFKDEKKRQEKVSMNIQQAFQGVRIQ